MIRKLLGAFCLLASVAAHGLNFKNGTNRPLSTTIHYHGYIPSISCRPDTVINLQPGATASVQSYACIPKEFSPLPAGVVVRRIGFQEYEAKNFADMIPK